MSKPGASANRTTEQRERDQIRDRIRYKTRGDKLKQRLKEQYRANPAKFCFRKKLAYAADPEKFLERSRNRTPEQKQQYLEAAKQTRAANPEKVRESARKWRLNNAEKVRAAKKAYYEANRAARLEKDRLNRLKNLERFREYDRQRNASKGRQEAHRRSSLRHPETVRQGWRNRRAKERGADGSHTPNDVAALFLAQQGRCAGCDAEMALSGKERYHVDHYLALALGGSDWPENLQLLCRPCNQAKGAKSPEVWETVIRPRRKRQQQEAA